MQAPQKDSPEFQALYSAGALEGQIDAQRVLALRCRCKIISHTSLCMEDNHLYAALLKDCGSLVSMFCTAGVQQGWL